MQLIVITASEAFSKRIILYLQLCDLLRKNKKAKQQAQKVSYTQIRSLKDTFSCSLAESLVYDQSEILKAALLQLGMFHIPQRLMLLTEQDKVLTHLHRINCLPKQSPGLRVSGQSF